MDSALTHKTEHAQEALDGLRHSPVYLPPYFPFLNPIEECLSKYKQYVKRHNLQNQETLIERLEEAASRITALDCLGWIQHAADHF